MSQKVPVWVTWALGLVISCAVASGMVQSTISDMKMDVKDLRSWKDDAIKEMAVMDTKLDLLLKANGVEYKEKK